jgi:uncharacterized iron-regulated membrane protein
LKIKSITYSLRKYRTWHRWIGISVGVLVLISSLSGILLALKKDVNILQPPTQRSEVSSKAEWMPIREIGLRATEALKAHTGLAAVSIDRMDVRPSKGIVKVNFEQGYWEVQVDGYQGEILSIARRHSDWIEQVHDGSIISDAFKLASMHMLGLGLLVLTLSGFWLWFGPRKIRKIKKNQKAEKNRSKFV